MGYDTILVHVDLSRHARQRIEVAAAIGAEHGSHLVGAAMTGIASAVFPHGYNVPPGTLLASYVEPLAHSARRALDDFETIARRHGVSHEARMLCDQVPDGLALLARFADLAVVTQDDPDESLGNTPSAARMPDYVVLKAGRPVLVVPRAAPPATCPRRIMLCWNGSRQASSAMTGALPLLRRADRTTLAVFAAADGSDCVSDQELADAQAFLERHGVRADLARRDPPRGTRSDIGGAMLALAAERGCDLLVMGCYGHSRFQQLLLGGASSTVLRDAALPVLMAR
ncbi:universal stress protein [Massilia sp.]|uniref:universal stress protein n=1 Tax=Massilia sp. TaxID=1882437 RepID=UPI0028AD0526|nr:universal stress protein [Massilia sp.]